MHKPRQTRVPVLPQELPEPANAFEYRRSQGSAHDSAGGCWVSVTRRGRESCSQPVCNAQFLCSVILSNVCSARFYSRQRHFVEIPSKYEINASNELVINSVIAWSFYPKLLVRDGKGWRNIANNQSVSLYPTSVNKGVSNPPKWLSFYHIMQSSNK